MKTITWEQPVLHIQTAQKLGPVAHWPMQPPPTARHANPGPRSSLISCSSHSSSPPPPSSSSARRLSPSPALLHRQAPPIPHAGHVTHAVSLGADASSTATASDLCIMGPGAASSDLSRARLRGSSDLNLYPPISGGAGGGGYIPSGSGATRRQHSPGLQNSELNKLIKSTQSWQELQPVVEAYGWRMNHIHVSAAITHLAQLQHGRSSSHSSSTLGSSSSSSSHSSGTTGLSHGDASLSSPTYSSSSAAAAAAAAAGRSSAQRSHSHHPEQRSSMSSSLPSPTPPAPSDMELHSSPPYMPLLQSCLGLATEHIRLFGSRQLANMCWALATLGTTAGTDFMASQLLPHSRALLPWFEPQHLANTAWAMAKSGVPIDDPWVEQFLLACELRMEAADLPFEGQHLANTLWSLARMGIVPDARWFAACFGRLEALLPRLSPLDVSQVRIM